MTGLDNGKDLVADQFRAALIRCAIIAFLAAF